VLKNPSALVRKQAANVRAIRRWLNAFGQRAKPRLRGVAGVLLAALLYVWLRTLRITFEGPPLPAGAQIIAFFHGRQFALLRWPRPRRTAVLVSQSADGDVQSALMSATGLVVFRGSSSRSASAGLRRLLRHLRGGASIALAVDGPRGPHGAPKPGAAFLAKTTAARVVPLGSAASPAWILRRSWDRMLIPWPFARVAVVHSEPLDSAEAGLALNVALERVTLRACALVRSKRN
jgi:lysophospholipid acyltransferase (LPLAT)-like uncharacterized protein